MGDRESACARMATPTSTATSCHFHSDLALDLGRFINNPHLHDVVVLCNDTSFFAHKDVLRARCAVLHDLFRSNDDAVLEIDTDPTVVAHLLKFVYTARFPEVDSIAHVTELLRLARHLQLHDLVVNLGLRFHDQVIAPSSDEDDEGDERCERSSPERRRRPAAEGPAVFHRPRHHSLTKFLDASRFDGKVTVVVGPYRFRRQCAILLASRSTWFADRIDAPDAVVDASAFPIEQMARVLRFLRMEGPEDTFANVDAALEAHRWATVLGAHSLLSWIEHVIVTRFISANTVCTIWSTVECSEYLAERCQAFIQDHFIECASSPGFLTLRADQVKGTLNAGM